MPFKLTTRHPVTTLVPEGQGDPQLEFYRQLAKRLGGDVPVYSMRVVTDERAFVDIKDVEQHLLDTFGLVLTFKPTTEHPDQRYNDEHTSSGDPLYVHLQRVSTSELRGPWLSGERGSTLHEIINGWNAWHDHPGAWINDPDPQGANS